MWPSELQHLVDSAERQGCEVVSAVFDGERARIVVEKDGRRFHNSGPGRVVDGKFEFFLRLSGPVDDEDPR
jgi:hypothetical protein